MPEGRTLRLLFGDFDIESSAGCSNGSLLITDKSGEASLGELDGGWLLFFLNICEITVSETLQMCSLVPVPRCIACW